MQILIGIDQLINTICGGYADETISARIYRKRHDDRLWMWLHAIVDGLFFWQPNHCKSSYQSEQNRKQLPAEYQI
jgi:hypothetical protein